MKQFRIILYEPQMVLVNAETEEDAIETVKKQLIKKPADNYKIEVVEEKEN